MRLEQTSIEKHTVPVRVQFPDGSYKNGLMFLRQGQRVLDVLCENKDFFPLKTLTNLALVNKNNVSAIDLLDRDAFEAQKSLFPPFQWQALDHRSW
jgi:hypothetical protein